MMDDEVEISRDTTWLACKLGYSNRQHGTGVRKLGSYRCLLWRVYHF